MPKMEGHANIVHALSKLEHEEIRLIVCKDPVVNVNPTNQTFYAELSGLLHYMGDDTWAVVSTVTDVTVQNTFDKATFSSNHVTYIDDSINGFAPKIYVYWFYTPPALR